MKNLRILIACEESQEVAKAFRACGIEAWSCDVLQPSGGHPEWHYECDVIRVMNEMAWDAIIAFPPCTYLSSVGNRWFALEKDSIEWCRVRHKMREAAAKFFMLFVNHPCNYIAIENPVGYMNTVYRKPDQIIEPYQFGDPFKKRTCLWLKGLPKLEYTNILPKPGPFYISKGEKTKGRRIGFVEGIKGMSPIERQRVRAKTFPGIANAMAEQWGDFLLNEVKR